MLRDEYIIERVRQKDRAANARHRLVEALDVDDLKKTRQAIEQIKAAAGPAWDKLPALQTGLETAREKLTTAAKSIGDDFGGLASFKSRMLDKAGAQVSLALTDTFTFVTSILSGFKSFDEAANAFVITVKTDNGLRKLSVTDLGDDFKAAPLSELKQRVEDKLGRPDAVTTNASAVASLLLRALRPKGLLAMMKRLSGGSGIPYVDEKALAEQLMGLSYNELVAAGEAAQAISPPIGRDDLVTTLKASQDAPKRPSDDVPTPTDGADFAPRAAKLVDKLDAKKRKTLLLLLKKAAQRDAAEAKAKKQAQQPPKSA